MRKFIVLILAGFLFFPLIGCAAKCHSWAKIQLESQNQVACRRLSVDRKGALWICARARGHKGRCHHHTQGGCKHTWQHRSKVKHIE